MVECHDRPATIGTLDMKLLGITDLHDSRAALERILAAAGFYALADVGNELKVELRRA